MKSHNLSLSLVIFCALAIGGSAQTLYWDGGAANISTNGDGISGGAAGTWDNSIQNWDQGAGQPHTAWVGGADAIFGAAGIAPGSGTVTLGAAITANSITVTAPNYVFTDGGNTANTLTVNTINNNNNSLLYVSNNIINTSGFTAAGTDRTILLAASPGLVGPINITGGTLQLGSEQAAGPINFGDVAIAANATLELQDSAGSFNIVQNISGGGSLSFVGASYKTKFTVIGDNTFTGDVVLNQCNVYITSVSDSGPSSLGMGTNVTLGTGASTTLLDYEGYGDTTYRTLTLGGTGNDNLVSMGYGPLVWNGSLVFSTNYPDAHSFVLGGTYNGLNVFGGTISDNTGRNLTLTQNGATWMLAGSNSYSGGTVLEAGTLLIANDDALGVSTNPVTFIPYSGSSYMSGGIKSISNNVTLGASRVITVTGPANRPAYFGVYDTNNLDVASYITGSGSVSKGPSGYTLGWVRFSNDTNDFTGTFSMKWGNTEFTSVADSGVPSSLGSGTANSGTIVITNSTSFAQLRYVGATNSATTRPLDWAGTTGGLALDVTNTGTIAYLATGDLKSGSGSAQLHLNGSNTGTNTLAQVINDLGGATTLTKSGTGQWVLTGMNTYSGGTTISGGVLTIGSDANLGAVPASVTANSLTIDSGTLHASASFALNANRGIALGPTGTNLLGEVATGDGTIDVDGGQTLTYEGIMANDTTTNSGGLIKAGAGTLTLSGANTYSGDTTISNGTLALSGSGSIAGSASISILGGATLDVSGVSGGYTLASGQTLLATNDSTATVNGSLNLGSAGLVLGYLNGTPAIQATGGAFTLASGNALTVQINNGGTPLPAGNYALIAAGTGGSVAGTVPAAVTLTGDVGTNAALSISNNELYLVVSGGNPQPPVLNSFSLTGGQAVLGFSGPSGQTWKVLSSTNVATPLSNWTAVATGTFTGSAVSYTNTTPVDPQRFYLITSP